MTRATVAIAAILLAGPVVAQTPTVGLLRNDPGAAPGYTLFTPLWDGNTYLLDLDGRVVHSWPSDGIHHIVYLLPSGHLLRTTLVHDNPTFGSAGGAMGMLEELDWDGNLIWSYRYSTAEHMSHHDVEWLPNGNVVLIAWELRSGDEAIAAGRDPSLLADGELWPDTLVEIEPDGAGSARVVWEWKLWDHLVQDFDPTRANYDVVSDRPERADINFVTNSRDDWTHMNAVGYNAALDQLVVSVRTFSEVWVLDHSTTTAEAAGSTGGRQGRGGDILYRWGNPRAYKVGDEADQMLFGQHDAHWIAPGLPGAGNLLVFNNGPRPSNYSTVDEWVTPVDELGGYPWLPGVPYAPAAATWVYTADPRWTLWSQIISGADRQRNGNTLICAGTSGRLFEVTADSRVVWEYLNPSTWSGQVNQGERIPAGDNNFVHRARRYSPDDPGLIGRDLTPRGPIELYSLLRNRDVTALEPMTPARTVIFTGTGPRTSLDRLRDAHLPSFQAGGVDDELSLCDDRLVLYEIDWPTSALKLVAAGTCGVRVTF